MSLELRQRNVTVPIGIHTAEIGGNAGHSKPPIIIELGGGSGRFCWQFLNRLFNYHFSDDETPLMMLAGDLAFTDPAQFELTSPLIFDTYFAHYTNFHVFAEQFRQAGGQAQFQRHADPNFACGAFLLGGRNRWKDISLEPTRRAAEQLLKEFAPYDAHELCELIGDSVEEASIRQILAWIRLSKFDPKIAELSLPLIMRQVEQGEDHINPDQIYETYMEAYRSYFPDGSETTIDCGIAHLFLSIGQPAAALALIRQSRVEFGSTARRLFIEALSLFRLGDRDAAHEARVADWQSAGLGKPNNVGDRRHTVPLRIQAPFNDPAVFANPSIINVLTEVMGERPTLHAFGAVVTQMGARMQHVHREHPLLFNDDRAKPRHHFL